MALFESDLSNDGLTKGKRLILGLQHTFTMFGATVLVPILTGMNISVALFMVGIGTLVFHVITKGKVPAFMGSSFAFIPPTIAAATMMGQVVLPGGSKEAAYAAGLPYAQGGLVIAGILYILFGLLIYVIGSKRIMSFFPPIVTGPIIMVIGLTLAPNAIEMASSHWGLAFVSFAIVVVINLFTKGFIQVLPVLFGLVGGYLVALLMGQVDYALITQEAWVGVPAFTMAKFSVSAVLSVAPVVIVTMVEHIGDVVAIGATVNRDFVKDPGLHRTVLGDGVAIVFSTMFGGPANTTYSENTGVLALTKVYNPVVMRIAACFAILLSVVPKLGGVIRSIPVSVIGGISIVLFGMIAAIGARTLVENKVDFQSSRNLIIAAVILVLGLGGASIPVKIGSVDFTISGMALAAIAGIALNKLVPERFSGKRDEVDN